MTILKTFRHPGLVPGSTVPQTKGSKIMRNGRCRNEPGMTEGERA